MFFFQLLTPTVIPYVAVRGIQTSGVLSKVNKLHIRAGRFRPTALQNLHLTYEESKPPYLIGVEKSWSTWNTSKYDDSQLSFLKYWYLLTGIYRIKDSVLFKRKYLFNNPNN